MSQNVGRGEEEEEEDDNTYQIGLE